jgi:DNA-binding transcriptional MerR regulator
MARYLYRVNYIAGGKRDYEESDLPTAQQDFLDNGSSIRKIELYYTLSNDPQGNRKFEQSDDADAARAELIEPLQANVDVAYAKIPHYIDVDTGLTVG